MMLEAGGKCCFFVVHEVEIWRLDGEPHPPMCVFLLFKSVFI